MVFRPPSCLGALQTFTLHTLAPVSQGPPASCSSFQPPWESPEAFLRYPWHGSMANLGVLVLDPLWSSWCGCLCLALGPAWLETEYSRDNGVVQWGLLTQRLFIQLPQAFPEFCSPWHLLLSLPSNPHPHCC